ncbi:hypothetical protein [Mobilicoccus pelagius]|uniref:hypothetical protein n=1 Tax=Mobilicoccus pelagius TaxID=746032 RepID=UPI0002DC55B1|nr:hypothetical protein [Mobilicoccus pelagius]
MSTMYEYDQQERPDRDDRGGHVAPAARKHGGLRRDEHSGLRRDEHSGPGRGERMGA